MKKYIQNIRTNFIWIISALAWFFVQYTREDYREIVFIGFILAVLLVAAVNEFLFGKIKKVGKRILGISILATVGEVIFGIKVLNANVILSLAAVGFVFSIFAVCYDFLSGILKDIYQKLEKDEKIVIGVIVVAYLILMTGVYSMTNAFYSAGVDVIYTADTKVLAEQNAYMAVAHVENDIRQPLFAVAATPFVACFYAISSIFSFIPRMDIVMLGASQVLLLLFTCVLLVQMLNLKKRNRIICYLLSAVMYPVILFALTFEQYVTAVFWIVLFVYVVINRIEHRGMVLVGAAGSLLTSAPLVLFQDAQEAFTVKKRFVSVLRTGMTGVLAVLLFARLDVVLTAINDILFLTKFTGEGVSFMARFFQFTNFVKSCFVTPASGEMWGYFGIPGWQLCEVSEVVWSGVLLFIAALAGFWLTREKLFSKISLFWVLYSVVILCVIGWGTSENGLILYSLYFGWAYWILVYQLLQYMVERWIPRKFQCILWGGVFGILVGINGKGLLELLIFARFYYPV